MTSALFQTYEDILKTENNTCESIPRRMSMKKKMADQNTDPGMRATAVG